MTETIDGVIIVGAGPVGLVAALKLAQSGIRTLVVDAAACINDSPRAVVYHSPTVEALDRLGVLDDMRQLGVLKQDTQWRARDGTILGSLDLSTLRPDETAYPYHLHLGQHRLADIVMQHLLRLPDSEVRWNHKLIDLSQNGDRVTLGIEVEGERRELTAPWVVGADGASSSVRPALGLGFEGHTWPEWFVATDLAYDFEAFGYAKATFIVDPMDWAVIPQVDRNGLFRVTYGEPAEVPRDALRGRLDAKYEALLPDGRKVEPVAFSPYRVHDRVADRFRVGRVLLAGDAAHVVNPIGGLGLTNGLLDAVALGDALTAAIIGRAPEDVLDHYADERRQIFTDIVSPAARENKRRLSEADPDRRRADAARLRQMTEDPGFARQTLLFTDRLVSQPIAA